MQALQTWFVFCVHPPCTKKRECGGYQLVIVIRITVNMPLGTYAKGLGSKFCTECEPGRYQTDRGIAGQEGCEACPHGTANNGTGLVFDDKKYKHACFVCKAGDTLLTLQSGYSLCTVRCADTTGTRCRRVCSWNWQCSM